MTLDALAVGTKALVRAVRCTGLLRARLADFGMLPGTLVEVMMASPLGDPRSYRVRGAVIALRKEDAAQIEVEEAA